MASRKRCGGLQEEEQEPDPRSSKLDDEACNAENNEAVRQQVLEKRQRKRRRGTAFGRQAAIAAWLIQQLETALFLESDAWRAELEVRLACSQERLLQATIARLTTLCQKKECMVAAGLEDVWEEQVQDAKQRLQFLKRVFGQ